MHLHNHNQKHNNNDENYLNWDGTVQFGGINHQGSRHTVPYFVYEMELEDNMFHGKGILHSQSPLCPESKNVFEIEITGNCDGTNFRLGGGSGSYNVTASEFNVLCVEK